MGMNGALQYQGDRWMIFAPWLPRRVLRERVGRGNTLCDWLTAKAQLALIQPYMSECDYCSLGFN